ncbi:MAG: hypothetical protein J5876_04795 [Lachnospiraceae bacterium]|nr:hypothetical protein [Lachnospiraceae bacterium]MBO4461998.1 hypothetical protein [Lachnospiraceae bacterium]
MFNGNQRIGGLKATGEILLDYQNDLKLRYTFELVKGEKVEEEEPAYMKEYDYDQSTGVCYGYRWVRLDSES